MRQNKTDLILHNSQYVKWVCFSLNEERWFEIRRHQSTPPPPGACIPHRLRCLSVLLTIGVITCDYLDSLCWCHARQPLLPWLQPLDTFFAVIERACIIYMCAAMFVCVFMLGVSQNLHQNSKLGQWGHWHGSRRFEADTMEVYWLCNPTLHHAY